MNIIEQLLNLFGRKKNSHLTAGNPESGIMSHRELETTATTNSTPPEPYSGGGSYDYATKNATTGVTTTYMDSGAVIAQKAGHTPYRVKPGGTDSAEAALAARSEGMNEIEKLGEYKTPTPNDALSARSEGMNTRYAEEIDKGRSNEPISGSVAASADITEPADTVMNRSEALRAAGLDGIVSSQTSTEVATPKTPAINPAELYSAENIHVPSVAEVQAEATAYSRPAANTPNASTSYEQDIPSANILNNKPSPTPTSQDRLDAGRQKRLDPDGEMGGFNDFGPTVNPNEGTGSDPTVGGGENSSHYAV